MESEMSGTENTKPKMKYVAVVSGGLDSTSYMASKLNGSNMEVLTFDYGQKAKRETESLLELCQSTDIPCKVLNISFMKELWKDTQLTDPNCEVKKEYDPSVVVPLRNGVMLMIAMAYAYSIKADYVLFGSHSGDITEFDHDGHPEYMYPDCSPIFAKSLASAGALGHFMCAKKVKLISPAMEHLGKDQLVTLGHEVLGDELFLTWSCYLNGEKQCGKCESCINRKKAFTKAKIQDRTEYE